MSALANWETVHFTSTASRKANTQSCSDQTQKKRRTWNEPQNQMSDKHLSFHNDLSSQELTASITNARGVVLTASLLDFSIFLIILTQPL